MKTQFLIFSILLMGILGLESLKREQFEHFWSAVSGPTLLMTLETKDIHHNDCPLKKQNSPVPASKFTPSIEENSITCFLFYKPNSRGFLTCEKILMNPAFDPNVL